MVPREPGRPVAGACLGECSTLTSLSRIGLGRAAETGRPAQPTSPAPATAQAAGLRGWDTAAERIRMAQAGAAQDRSVARSAAPQGRKGLQEVAGWSIRETEAGPTGRPWGPWARTQIGQASI